MLVFFLLLCCTQANFNSLRGEIVQQLKSQQKDASSNSPSLVSARYEGMRLRLVKKRRRERCLRAAFVIAVRLWRMTAESRRLSGMMVLLQDVLVDRLLQTNDLDGEGEK